MASRDARGARQPEDDDVITFHNEADASNTLFDLRYLIGGLFTIYGIVLIVASFFVSTVKSGGININLWLGLAMLVLGVCFLLWARTRPLQIEGRSALAEAEEEASSRERPPGH
jgi:cytochrome c biogenesis protein CcdA